MNDTIVIDARYIPPLLEPINASDHRLCSIKISRLYRPLDTEYTPSDSEDDLESGPNSSAGLTQLLPLQSSTSSNSVPNGQKQKAKANPGRLADVWDEGEELFDIGEESDEEEGEGKRSAGLEEEPLPTTPKIVVTSSDS